MARLNTHTSATPQTRSSTPSTLNSLYRDPTPLSRANASTARQSSYSVVSPSPPSPNSDKENDLPPSRETTSRPRDKATVSTMTGRKRGPRPSTPDSGSASLANTSKRRRTNDYEHGLEEGEEEVEGLPTPDAEEDMLKFYNPNQDPGQRRAVLLSIREQNRNIDDNRDQIVTGDGTEIIGEVEKMNHNMGKVRQTADAVRDSSTFLKVTDMASRHLKNCGQMRAGVGIDVDNFVSKCWHFMKFGHAPAAGEAAAPTQARNRRQTQQAEDDDDDDVNEGLDWALLGRNVCFASNRRPPTSSFLLGPLSLQKRARTVQSKRARSQRQPLGPATRPQELRQEDIQQSENTNLTHLVKGIRRRLEEHIISGSEKIEKELEEGDGEDAEGFFAACSRYRVYETPDGEPAVSLFDFAVNPNSFGQTVENLFYISFLIKEGNAKILVDDDNLPLLVPAQTLSVGEHRAQNMEKQQAIFSLDYQTWQDLIEAFNIKESLIPHRVSEQAKVASGGWYG
ncbi:Nse4-domain-containing protein [Massarina eburnea CBS 473.64]|uniref:Non-structural maintenance of chromosomes element 4 n=1 Tax=Massarina eburnea CBS 473.64 TaxID=1395130 RepID=A0A6A6RI30_9PLEO|nr:Nse4-domain-containing protein [Massarina eburnea CBS 473.64]